MVILLAFVLFPPSPLSGIILVVCWALRASMAAVGLITDQNVIDAFSASNCFQPGWYSSNSCNCCTAVLGFTEAKPLRGALQYHRGAYRVITGCTASYCRGPILTLESQRRFVRILLGGYARGLGCVTPPCTDCATRDGLRKSL